MATTNGMWGVRKSGWLRGSEGESDDLLSLMPFCTGRAHSALTAEVWGWLPSSSPNHICDGITFTSDISSPDSSASLLLCSAPYLPDCCVQQRDNVRSSVPLQPLL